MVLRFGIANLAVVMLACAEGFTFVIGSPVASQQFQFKAATFVFRAEGCADTGAPQVSATAEGILKGERQSVVLKVIAGSKPGVYAVFQTWPAAGQWIVNLKGTCGNMSAGAIVPMGPKGFIRESAKFFPRAATDSEIEMGLKTLMTGDKK
jgi:hypothetical protein